MRANAHSEDETPFYTILHDKRGLCYSIPVVRDPITTSASDILIKKKVKEPKRIQVSIEKSVLWRFLRQKTQKKYHANTLNKLLMY